MNERLTGLKRVAVFGASFGAGAVMTVALILAANQENTDAGEGEDSYGY